MNNDNNIDYARPMRLRIVNSQYEQLENIQELAKNNHGYTLYKNDFVKIAISELLEKISNDNDLKTTLEKYVRI